MGICRTIRSASALQFFPVDDAEELLHVGFGVGLDLSAVSIGRVTVAAGIADLRGPVADDQHDLVAELLKLAQFSQPDHVSQVDVRGTGVEAFFQPQFFPAVDSLTSPLDMLSETPLFNRKFKSVFISSLPCY